MMPEIPVDMFKAACEWAVRANRAYVCALLATLVSLLVLVSSSSSSSSSSLAATATDDKSPPALYPP